MNDLDMDFLVGADDDPSRRPRRTGRGRRRRRRRNRGGFLAPMLAVIILVGGLGAGGYYGYLWVRDAMTVEDYKGPGSGEVVVEIKEGESASQIAQTLREKDVVKSSEAFTDAITDAGKSSSLQPGEYRMRKRMAAAEAVKLLDPTKRLHERVIIKEGLRLTAVLEELAKQTGKPLKEFQQAAKNVKALDLPSYAKGKPEGYIFPATYEVTPKMTASDILAAMADRFKETAEKENLVREAKALGYTPHQIVTIASIVQAEAGNLDDMAKMSRVIYNRLHSSPPMNLGMDSTVMYALNKYGIEASHAETETASPYNTYKHPGLPPGPISNPGDDAIQAALNPAKGDWKFFVTVDPKRRITKFATNETDFFKLKAEYERNKAGG
ncbi:endolytic transglycosylase MltG [Streptosporangium nondiastaticum]|uniref:endolytic transglycosylase MltG n=1 Tax=Streptosporangium nondiastaticum TaxID=35764 RepID=UPI0031F74B53